MPNLCSLCIVLSCSFILSASNEEVPTPLKDLEIYILEGAQNKILHQFHKTNPNVVKFLLTGETGGFFHLEPNTGTLRVMGDLDRETKPVYNLKIHAVDQSNRTAEGPFSINIFVQDINDNKPMFNQSTYNAAVRERSRPGKTFITVHATDADDPATVNAQLIYSIIRQIPDLHAEKLFQINNLTGAISTTGQGYAQLDTKSKFELLVEVMDLAGKSENALSDNAKVMITVTESLWKTPAPVEVTENSTAVHPVKITEVRCNELNAKYELFQKQKYDWFPFSIDQKGDIYVTEPLDRERNSMYVFYASAKDNNGNFLERPEEVEVKVLDINDNPPVCGKPITQFEVQENEGIGSTIGTLAASDLDQEPVLHFRVLDQDPKLPADGMFSIKEFKGDLQLTKSILNKKQVAQYRLMVEVSDEALEPGQVLKTICHVLINVIDINKHAPIFESFDYGNLTRAEDTAVGTVILEIQAKDADEPFTGSSDIIYKVTKGDPSHVFIIDTDARTNRGYVKINKPLDFETFPEYSLEVQATNPESLVDGTTYEDNSNTRFRITVTNVDEPPIFNSSIYQVTVFENVPVGTKLKTIAAYDPEGGAIRFTLSENPINWLRLDPDSGDLFTAGNLDREAAESYFVRVIATETGNPSMQSSVSLSVTLRDVNDNAPQLARGRPETFFCHPITKTESVIIEATDADTIVNGPRFTFSLADDESTQRNWEIQSINRTHAMLTMKHTDFQLKRYSVPVKIKDRGNPPLEALVSVEVNICTCTADHQCFREAPLESKFPSVGMAVGILVGVLAFIGIIIGAVFISLNYKKKKVKKAAISDAKTQAETEAL